MAVSVRAQLGQALSQAGEVTAFPDLHKVMVRAARATLRREQITDAEVSITLLDDSEIADMNQRFLAHHGPTDVISFALYDVGEPPVGDIYIGWQQAERQAAQNGIDVTQELARLTIHGLLHVLGYDHPDGEQRVQSAMWLLQEDILTRVRS